MGGYCVAILVECYFKWCVAMTTDYTLGAGSRFRTSSQSSYVTDGVAEADVILLQASPLHHPYWQPVTINIGECSSTSSSLCGSPVAQRKWQESPKLVVPTGKATVASAGQHSSQLNSGVEKGTKKLRSRPASLSVSDNQHVVLIEHLTPPTSPKHRVAFRSLSADDDEVFTPKQPSSPRILTLASSLKLKRSNVSLNETVPEAVFQTSTPTSSMEKLNRFKDRLLRSVISTSSSIEENGEIESDSESTPLVSEMASPISEDYNHVARLFLKQGFADNASCSDSSGEASASLECAPMSQLCDLPRQERNHVNANTLAVDDDNISCSSSVSLTNVLEPTSNFYHLVAIRGSMNSVRSGSSGSQELLEVGDFQLRRKSMSGSFSRQDALDQSENCKDGEEKGSNPETTV